MSKTNMRSKKLNVSEVSVVDALKTLDHPICLSLSSAARHINLMHERRGPSKYKLYTRERRGRETMESSRVDILFKYYHAALPF